MNKLVSLTTIGIIACFVGNANATQPHSAKVSDHYKAVIVKIPTEYEVCTKGNGKTDLENFITGGLIGGAIGNNIPGEKGGAAIGAIIGGALNAERNKGMTCKTLTTYKKEMETIYSHSTIKFNYNGRSYSVSFKK